MEVLFLFRGIMKFLYWIIFFPAFSIPFSLTIKNEDKDLFSKEENYIENKSYLEIEGEYSIRRSKYNEKR